MSPPANVPDKDPALKVGEIFASAGAAFKTLGELTTQLNNTASSSSRPSPSATNSGGGVSAKWTQEEMDLLHQAVSKFANDLHQISERIKGRTVQQIKTTLKRKAFDEAGLSLEDASSSTTSPAPPTPVMNKADVTLNALNASENEVDVEGMGEKLDFGSRWADCFTKVPFKSIISNIVNTSLN